MVSVKLILVFFVFQIIVFEYGVEARRRELHDLNNSPVKTFHIGDNDIYVCFEVHKQPTLDHPLLKNHKIQMRPTWQRGLFVDTSSKIQSTVPLLRGVMCPEGTVPIRRTHKENLISTESYSTNSYPFTTRDPSHHVAAIKPSDDQGKVYRGMHGNLNLFKMEVKNGQLTASQLWFENGPVGQRNSLQTGWMISPQVLGDNRTRLFAYWTPDSGKTGCYNTLCPGFVQVDKTYTLGMEFVRLSKIGDLDKQEYVAISISQERATGNWWLTYNETIHVGYWPKALLPGFAGGASLVAWGGFATGTPGPPMGNGNFPLIDFRPEACVISQLSMLDSSDNIIYPDENRMVKFVDSPTCYGLQYYGHRKKNYGHVFEFGGPGGQC